MVDSFEKIQGGKKWRILNKPYVITETYDTDNIILAFFYWVYVNTDKYSQLVQRLIDTLSN